MSHKHETEQAFLEDIKARLDQSEDRLDDLTLMRLRRIRQQAVQAGSSNPPKSEVISRRERWLMPTASIAATVVITVMAFMITNRTSLHDEDMLAAVEDIPILEAEPAPEFYENLDFYLWLDEQKDLG